MVVLAACGTGGGETTTTTGGRTATTTTTHCGQRRHRWHRPLRLRGRPGRPQPGGGSAGEDYIVYDLVYDSLLNIDLEGNFQPEVATDWSVSDDGLTWTLTIRDDITFHDGTPLTAEDVVYSLTLYRDTARLSIPPQLPDPLHHHRSSRRHDRHPDLGGPGGGL